MSTVPRLQSTPTREWGAGFLSTDCDKNGKLNVDLYEVGSFNIVAVLSVTNIFLCISFTAPLCRAVSVMSLLTAL
jgi:hypothetical protein